MTTLATTIFDHTHPIIFGSTFNLCEFVSTCKKSGNLDDLFWRYGWLKYPAIWLAENISMSKEQKFSQIWDLCRNTTNNMNFHYRTNLANVNRVIPCQMSQNFKGWDKTHPRFRWNFSRWKAYERRLSWKFQHKLIAHSKVMTPQSWHGKLKIDKNKGVRQLGCIFESQ